MAKQETSLMAYAGSLTAAVEQKVAGMLADKRLDLPADYSANNALKAMQLAVMQTEDRNKRPALEVCTKESIIECMLSMVVQGLNPAKKQCYPIVYGNKLTLFRSYFGAMAVAKRVDPTIKEINASVVYKNDTIKSHKSNGKLIIDTHEQDMLHMDKSDLVGAYATVVYMDGTTESDFRTFDQIKQAWKQSIIHPVDDKGNIKEGTTHDKFTEDMCLRTVINRVCKKIINSSSDESIVAQYAKATQAEMDMAEADETIMLDANTGEIIDIDEIEEVEVVEPAPVEEQPAADEAETEAAPAKKRGRKPKEETETEIEPEQMELA